MKILLGIAVVMNILAFMLMKIDKNRARQHARRISERTLFLAAGLFGGIGGTLGMFICHHKTKHWQFRVFFPVLMLIQIAGDSGDGSNCPRSFLKSSKLLSLWDIRNRPPSPIEVT